MRERYDEQGYFIGAHQMIFDNIPDDYRMKKVVLDDKVPDLSYVGVMKYLRSVKAGEEFSDDIFYSKEVLSHLALDYIHSALLLQKGIAAERGQDIVSYYLIPCAYLCKHSIELKLKECLLEKYGKLEGGHSVLALWNALNEKELIHYKELDIFIKEVEKIDSNEMALRYGISTKLTPLQESFKFDIDNMLTNTMFLFNVVDEYIVGKYRYKGK